MFDLNKIVFKKYKCFKGETIIENVKPINIVIGKNNIGKSSLLDIIEIINSPELLWNNRETKIYIEKKLEDSEIESEFGKTTFGGNIPTHYHYDFGKNYIGDDFRFELYPKNYSSSIILATRPVNNITKVNERFEEKYKSYWDDLATKIQYTPKSTKRIYAERNINPEKETASMKVSGYGEGITSVINNYLNKAKYNENKIRKELLEKLNEIMGIDAHFTEITTQQVEYSKDDIRWEIFLREENKGRIALSKSGSGLKTILMVLVYTILLPDIENKDLSEYIFLFEELENNLHPSLERRLLKYIEEISQNEATIFLTTHSSTVLDSFQNNDNVQMYHVKKENELINLNALDNILGKKGCLDDIGIKASDILQSNGIIWVEGPSDRIYINKWIDLWSNGKYKEGMNYQCVFYGGRLLSNTTFEDENIDNLVNLMNVNKNSIILIDSDKTSKSKPINTTKKRIQREYKENNQLCWITKGKEIENYVPKHIISTFYDNTVDNDFEQYQTIDAFLNLYKENEGEKFKKSKIKYAKEYIEKMTLDNMHDVLDLDENMKKVIKEIEKWNKL